MPDTGLRTGRGVARHETSCELRSRYNEPSLQMSHERHPGASRLVAQAGFPPIRRVRASAVRRTWLLSESALIAVARSGS